MCRQKKTTHANKTRTHAMYVPRSINVRRQVMRFFKEACRNKSNYTRYNETPVQTKQEQSTQIQCIIRSMNICRLVIRSKRQTRGNISNYIAGFQHGISPLHHHQCPLSFSFSQEGVEQNSTSGSHLLSNILCK